MSFGIAPYIPWFTIVFVRQWREHTELLVCILARCSARCGQVSQAQAPPRKDWGLESHAFSLSHVSDICVEPTLHAGRHPAAAAAVVRQPRADGAEAAPEEATCCSLLR